MHVHILGICGTFMGGLALLARAKGHRVTGSDTNVYPPMSTQLEEQGIELIQGFAPEQLDFTNAQGNKVVPDLIVIGNAMSRGNPCVEAILNQGLAYTSGPGFLADYILPERWVLAVSGTHGKTSTSSMLAWILEANGYEPGFLIGGVPQNFGVSARLGNSPFFVVEADEYDSAFFDKRSKFVHYRPRTLVINNLEFDHADIFADLAAIQRQFNHVVRTVPGQGKIIWPKASEAVQQVIAQGCWSEEEHYYPSESQQGWYAHQLSEDGHHFEVYFDNQLQGEVEWDLIGNHNIENAIMAIAAARHVGVVPEQAVDALVDFSPPKRRLELLADIHGIEIYDDFAHHPTAITSTLAGVRAKVGERRVIAVLEPRSNTMKTGVHKDTLAASLQQADKVYIYQSANIGWDVEQAMAQAENDISVCSSVDRIVDYIAASSCCGDTILVMSNGGFNGIHQKLIDAIKLQHGAS